MKMWHDLDTERPIGMVVGRIPRSKIVARLHEPDCRDLDDEARSMITDAIRYVDDLEHAERAKKQPTKQPPVPRGPIARTAQGAGR